MKVRAQHSANVGVCVSGELLSKRIRLEAELKQNTICKHLKKLEKFEASSRIKGLAQDTSTLMERLPWTGLDFPLGLQSSGLPPHRSSCLTTQEGSLAPSPGLPPSLAGPLAWQLMGRDVLHHAPCYATRTSPQGPILQGPTLAQLSTSARVISVRLGHVCTWRKSWADSPGPEELLKDRRHASQGPLSPREVRAPVTVSHCFCSFRHRKGPRKDWAEMRPGQRADSRGRSREL